MRSRKGFTLVEVLIAVFIMAAISTLTALSISRSLKYKVKLEREIDEYTGARNALIVITNDVNKAFHWKDINQEIKDKMIAEAKAANKEPPFAVSAQPPGLNAPIEPEKLTGFVGNKDSLYLTTLSHVRTILNSPESDQAKIGYYMKDVKSSLTGQNVKALMRSESYVLDGEDLTRNNERETVLLEGVKKLTFRYMGGDNKEWQEAWKSTAVDDAKMSKQFPNAVEITITTTRNEKDITVSTIAAINMPNNPKSSPAPQGGTLR